jgi:hypothetical protein
MWNRNDSGIIILNNHKTSMDSLFMALSNNSESQWQFVFYGSLFKSIIPYQNADKMMVNLWEKSMWECL